MVTLWVEELMTTDALAYPLPLTNQVPYGIPCEPVQLVADVEMVQRVP